MAPRPPDIPEDEETWLDEVAVYYERRGLAFERHPKVLGRPISLHRLYKLAMEHGGYDELSAERMRWRNLGKQLGFSSHQDAALSFSLKTVYYKNLAAYEISAYWGEEPPPPEILEKLTARGGDLRSRTLENFTVPTRDSAPQDDGGEGDDEDHKTPRPDSMDIDEPGSGSRYPTRQLRQDPKRTQLFQPDIVQPRQRQARTTTSPQSSPVPAQSYVNLSSDPRNPAFRVDRYEPRQPVALTLRPVLTPRYNPDLFYQRKAMAKIQTMPRLPLDPTQFLRSSIPNNMTGPNIYLRCLYGLRSGVATEQDFALHHLVKVSYERGDKYKFEGFPLLAESLLEKALEITVLVYGVTWEISYDEPERDQTTYSLNAAYGTSNILDRLKTLKVQEEVSGPAAEEFAQKLDKLHETILVLRNMVILEENGAFISRFPLFRDFLTIAINLPPLPQVVEFRHYALEIAEYVTRYWDMRPDDLIYLSLLSELESDDRGAIICALRALNRIGLETPNTHRLTHVKLSTMERLLGFLLLENDDELASVSLDFIYKFTASPENVDQLLTNAPKLISSFIPRLVALIQHGALPIEEKIMVRAAVLPNGPSSIPVISQDLHHQLLQFREPERSSRWLRCCFEDSQHDDITQIAIWQAYQGRFMQNNPIPAAEFIKNVSNTFKEATAQVINLPQPRFIIKGIRPRRALIDTNGVPQFKCLWEVLKPDNFDPNARLYGRHLCNSWHSTREKLWTHMLADHLGLNRTEDGKFAHDSQANYMCKWSGCLRSTPLKSSLAAGKHVKIHVPESPEAAAAIAEGVVKEAEYTTHTFYSSMMEENTHPCGIPYMSVMTLRNLARFANRFGRDYGNPPEGREKIPLIERLFGSVKPDLWHVLSVNKTLGWLLTDLMKMIEKGESVGSEDKGEKDTNESGSDNESEDTFMT